MSLQYPTDNVLMETDELGTTQAVYQHEPGQFGSLDSMHRNGQTSTYHYDGQGNTRELTDSTETVTDTYTNDAFGNEVAKTGTTTNPYRFGGQHGYQYNESTGDYYIRARTYEPKQSRWVSKDPQRFADGLNAYVYASNGPVGATDPSGMAPPGTAKTIPVYCCPDKKLMLFGHIHATKLFYHKSQVKNGKTVYGPHVNKLSNANGIGYAIHFTKSLKNQKNINLNSQTPDCLPEILEKPSCDCDALHFIQAVETNWAINGGKGVQSFIDGSDPILPFYDTGSLSRPDKGNNTIPAGFPFAGKPTTSTLSIYDKPFRFKGHPNTPKSTFMWRAVACVVCSRKTGLDDLLAKCVTYSFKGKVKRSVFGKVTDVSLTKTSGPDSVMPDLWFQHTLNKSRLGTYKMGKQYEISCRGVKGLK